MILTLTFMAALSVITVSSPRIEALRQELESIASGFHGKLGYRNAHKMARSYGHRRLAGSPRPQEHPIADSAASNGDRASQTEREMGPGSHHAGRDARIDGDGVGRPGRNPSGLRRNAPDS